MKAEIHPEYKQTTIKCACGNVIKTGSTKENATVDICAKCHPFFTGAQKLVDTRGRIDKFNRRRDAANTGASANESASVKAPKAKATAKKAANEDADK